MPSSQVFVQQSPSEVERIKALATQQAKEFAEQATNADTNGCPDELRKDMNEHKIKPKFAASAQAIKLPQFFLKLPAEGGFFDSSDEWHKLAKEHLLADFQLANRDATINFASVESEVYYVDADEIGNNESSPDFKPVKKAQKERLNQIIKNQSESSQLTSMVERLFSLIEKRAFYPIEDDDIKRYLRRIVQAMDTDQRSDCLERDYAYIKAIKDKIQSLAGEFAAKEFNQWLTTRKVKLQPSFVLPATITPKENAPAISKSLYVAEAGMNSLEARIIQGVAELDNVVWWHRNLERNKGFVINGFLNHYPDFIVLTENKNVIIIETKGDDRDNSDSRNKLKLGKLWESQANQLTHETGYRYHYMMVFESNPMEDALLASEALKLIGSL